MRVLYLLRDGEYMPIQLSLPPTSIRPFSNFVSMAFAARHRPVFGSVVQIGLKRMNNGSNDYSVATFSKLYDFTGEELAQIKAYALSFKEQIHLMLQERAAVNEDQCETGCENSVIAQMPPDNGIDYSLPIEINGDRDALPA